MSTLAIYGLCLVGALGLFLLMRPGEGGRRTAGMRGLGAVLGLGALAYLVLAVTNAAVGPDRAPGLFFTAFALISVVSAVQMITSSRPVYSALHFVLVVLASAGLFLMLAAEFMAFALIIIYAGAILITYMFVLMLAQQAPSALEEEQGAAEYDRFAREPAAGAIVAFVLLAVLTQTVFDRDGGAMGARPAADPPGALVASWARLTEMPRRIEEVVEAEEPAAVPVFGDDGMPAMNLVLGVRAELEGRATWDELTERVPAGVTVEDVDRADEAEDGELSTVAMLEIDAEAAGLDPIVILRDPGSVENEARAVLAAANLPMTAGGFRTFVTSVDATVLAQVPAEDGAGTETAVVRLPGSARPDNIQEVGLALITRFPASLEIAGVILLMAMFGAVILARRQIEIGEDEKRAAAGLRPLGDYDEGDDGTDDAAAAAGGAA